jgi:hypothetical protein
MISEDELRRVERKVERAVNELFVLETELAKAQRRHAEQTNELIARLANLRKLLKDSK